MGRCLRSVRTSVGVRCLCVRVVRSRSDICLFSPSSNCLALNCGRRLSREFSGLGKGRHLRPAIDEARFK